MWRESRERSGFGAFRSGVRRWAGQVWREHGREGTAALIGQRGAVGSRVAGALCSSCCDWCRLTSCCQLSLPCPTVPAPAGVTTPALQAPFPPRDPIPALQSPPHPAFPIPPTILLPGPQFLPQLAGYILVSQSQFQPCNH